MPKWNWSDWTSVEVGVHSLCQSALTLLGELMNKLTVKRARVEAPGAEFYKLPDEVSAPFAEAVDVLLDITYRMREDMEWVEAARSGLSKIKNELIPAMRERLEGDAELEGLLSAVEALCDRANWMLPSSRKGQPATGEVSAVRKAVEALRSSKSHLFKAEAEDEKEEVRKNVGIYLDFVRKHWNEALELFRSEGIQLPTIEEINTLLRVAEIRLNRRDYAALLEAARELERAFYELDQSKEVRDLDRRIYHMSTWSWRKPYVAEYVSRMSAFKNARHYSLALRMGVEKLLEIEAKSSE